MQANGWGRSAPGAHQQHRIGYIFGHLVKRFPPLSQIGGIPLTSFSSYAFIGSPDYLLHNTLLERDGSEDQLALTPPFLVNRPQASNTTPVLTPEDGFPANFLSSSDINFNALQSYQIRALAMNDSAPYVHNTAPASSTPSTATGQQRWITSGRSQRISM
jgi:hypothetical protein